MIGHKCGDCGESFKIHAPAPRYCPFCGNNLLVNFEVTVEVGEVTNE